MKRLFCCALAAACLGATAARADQAPGNIDLATFTCAGFLYQLEHGHGAEMRSLAMWLDGYLGGISGNTEINWHDIRQYTEELIGYCRQNGPTPLLEAARKAGIL